MNKNKKVLAFDIGGTKIASALVEVGKSDYRVYDYQKTETPSNKDNVINKIIELAINYERNGGFGEICLAVAGQVDREKGVAKYAPNIKGFKNIDLKKIIQDKVGKKTEVKVDNDIKCFALAEDRFGKAGRYKHAVYLMIGTGIGGAIKIDGKLYRGADNIAGEFGHMTLVFDGEKCRCKNKGCWEQYASGTAIEKMYFDLSGEKKKAEEIARDSRRNRNPDKMVIKKASLCLAAGLVSIINTINPDIIVIGGGVAKSKEILDPAVKEAREKVLAPTKKIKIIQTEMEDEAVIIGAALL